MKKKTLYMIGNSHIDPVWFWSWEEGMQEVKATYASVLDRMKEFPDFRFTSTSTAFFEWIEEILPDMFEEIRQRVEEGRWELTGGWFIEPDCLLPGGEAFVRQGLYGQRWLKKRFGRICRIGSNVDSFGHNSSLPQILKKSGMDAYVFMRPRLDTPVFRWEGLDGSSICAISLPGEYTTWFYEPTKENIEKTLEASSDFDKMVCCYGVGNHGGGPTKDNIHSIHRLSREIEHVELIFSSYTDFLKDLDKTDLPLRRGPFERINVGCYSIDSRFKQANRLAEKRLAEAEFYLTFAKERLGRWMPEAGAMERLWKAVLFNQFHDTLGGTVIYEAREKALAQLEGACAEAEHIKALAIQRIVNTIDTRENSAEGFPLFLFHSGDGDWEGYVEAELNWFCKAPLRLMDPEGREVAYQRIYTETKTRNYHIGGRRRILFWARIPAWGYAVYRVSERESTLASGLWTEDAGLRPEGSCVPEACVPEEPCTQISSCAAEKPCVLENAYVRLELDPANGQMISLLDKGTGYDACRGSAGFVLFRDERDSWGGFQGRPFEDSGAEFELESLEKVEKGKMREAIRVIIRTGGTKIQQIYLLGAKDRAVTVRTRLFFAHPWSLLKFALPVGEQCCYVRSETAYGCQLRHISDEQEYPMQRFLDASDGEGKGLAIANNGKYAFHMAAGRIQITVARSAIYAQGNGKDWYDEKEDYRYHDMGEQDFTLALYPHGASVENSILYRLADRTGGDYEYLADSLHGAVCTVEDAGKGEPEGVWDSLMSTDASNVRICAVKKAEDDQDTVVRLLETEGRDTVCSLHYGGRKYQVVVGHDSITTWKLEAGTDNYSQVNLLEWPEEDTKSGSCEMN